MSKQPAKNVDLQRRICRHIILCSSTGLTLLKMYTMKVDRPAQPTACIDIEKQSPVEANSYPNSMYHDGHTDIVILLSKVASRLRQRRPRQFQI
jgi:hypothetical protein